MSDSKQVVDWETLCLRHEKLISECSGLRSKLFLGDIYEHVKQKSIAKLVGDQKCSFTRDNYQVPLIMLLCALEVYESIEMRKYDLLDEKIRKIPDPETNPKWKQPYLLEVTLPGLSEGQPKLIPPDNVVLEMDDKYEVCNICDINGDRVIFKRDPEYKRSWVTSKYYFPEPIDRLEFNVSFVPSGIQFDKYREAVAEAARSDFLRKALFESPSSLSSSSKHDLSAQNLATEKIDLNETACEALDKRLSRCNERQKQAIVGILEARCRPKPYILFGPPGTGKTFTVVEAIVQIYNRNKRLSILVCANSNNCADQLAHLIHQTNLVDSMKRLNSRNHYKEKSTIRSYDTCSRDDASDSRLVITTNNKAASLTTSAKFDYVFIDEAGHAHEAESLLPMLKVSCNGCLVLAGDPKQLGPVIKCREVEQLGLGESMLERLFNLEPYERNESCDRNYDRNFITKLVLSYRCDPRILALCNKLFYDGELSCRGECPESLLEHMNLSHPLVFHATKGTESRPATSTSRCNELEADLCVDYVVKLQSVGISADKIGVISPYSLQKDKITEKLSHKLRATKGIEDLMTSLNLKDVNGDENQGGSVAPRPQDNFGYVAQSSSDSEENNNCDLPADGKAGKGDQLSGKINGLLTRKMGMCQVDTVDAFQGQEKEIIILSTVRSPNEYGRIDQGRFLDDSKRFNVAISRAKWLVIVVGHPAVIECHKNWSLFGQLAEHLG